MKSLLAGFLLLGFVSSASAVTIGSLTYDETIADNEVITDSLNNLEWLRWDVLKDLTYAQTLDAISDTGEYNTWNIATFNEAQMFTVALLGTNNNNCTTSNNAYCGTSGVDNHALTGGNNFNNGYGYAWFLSDITEVGYMYNGVNGGIYKNNNWSSIAGSDSYSSSGANPSISWMLYRNTTSVPEASSLYLLAFGLLGLFGAARRKV